MSQGYLHPARATDFGEVQQEEGEDKLECGASTSGSLSHELEQAHAQYELGWGAPRSKFRIGSYFL